jgi:hypothetical protein
MIKYNCWEYMKCGRELGGLNAIKLGVCPASTEERVDGLNCGKNGGRVCWATAGTLCGGKVQGTFAGKLASCMKCEFFQLVIGEEADNCVSIEDILSKLKK